MSPSQNKRLGVVAIIIEDRQHAVKKINDILTDHADVIIGRLGLPQKNLSIISLIVDGSTDDIGALTGKIGQLDNVTVKTAFAKTSSTL